MIFQYYGMILTFTYHDWQLYCSLDEDESPFLRVLELVLLLPHGVPEVHVDILCSKLLQHNLYQELLCAKVFCFMP